MIVRVFSAALQGVDATEVEIEVHEARGDPRMIVVGLPDAAVRESRDRVLTAIGNSGFMKPDGRTTVNLAPADLKKEGPSFDLAIALGCIAHSVQFKEGALEAAAVVGELSLDGRVRPVKGVLSIAQEAKRAGRKAILVPEENVLEACLVDGLYVYGVPDLRAAADLLCGESGRLPERIDREALFNSNRSYDIDFSEVKGQAHVKRALEVAVAGNHNLLRRSPLVP